MMNLNQIQTWPKKDGPIPAQPDLPYPEERIDQDAIRSLPQIDPTAWVSPGAVVIGRVRLKAHSSVWFGSVLRGDDAYIEIGRESNVQDGSILHIEPGHSCILGDRVTLGHRATVHAAVVDDDAMIGIGATVLSRATIGKGALIAAGALILEETEVPPGTLWAGVPARQIRELTPLQKERMSATYKHYVNLAALYQKLHSNSIENRPKNKSL